MAATMMKHLILVCALGVIVAQQCAAAPLARCSVLDFGAKGDNATDDAAAINRAVQACDEVVFPSGRAFVTGSVRLQSNVTVVVEDGAEVHAAGTGNHAFDPIEHNPWAKYQDFGHTYFRNSMFWGIGVQNVTIRGGGHIYGDALPTGETSPGDGNKMFAIRSSQHIRFENIHLHRGGWFTIIVSNVDFLTLVDTEIDARRDGIDICQCRHVRVNNCLIHNGGDDALVLKSDYSTGPPPPSYDHVYSNSVIGSPGASALRFGSETVGDIRGIVFENITITGAAKAAVGIVSMDGSHISNLTYRNISATGTGIPFFLYIGARNRRPSTPGEPPHLGSISGITVENFVGTRLRDPDQQEHPFWYWPATLDGQDVNATYNVTRNVPVGPDVSFRNISLQFPGGGTANLTSIDPPHWSNEYEPWRYCPREYCPGGLALPAYAWFIRQTRGLTIDGLRISYDSAEARPAFVIEDAQNVTIAGVARAERGQGLGYDVLLRRTAPQEVHAPGLTLKSQQ